ncbi:hypothetical protein ZIOFF_059485 [Zingiber officinale]|uniref:Uncharacterized protein n=1 Tax=Zingiber officinale TaxID=94328 RepID=A0A8J5F7H1_ZINOF|nr:hypothetical protein ZIOFF_059485 [Zingiber officinale]
MPKLDASTLRLEKTKRARELLSSRLFFFPNSRSSNYMLCGTASEPQECDWKVLRRRTIKKALVFKREDG